MELLSLVNIMRTLSDLQTIAMKNNWVLNPNLSTINLLLQKQNKDHSLLGSYYCPCKKEKNSSNICPCIDAPEEIHADGHCHCMLYYPKNEIVLKYGFKTINPPLKTIDDMTYGDIQFSFEKLVSGIYLIIKLPTQTIKLKIKDKALFWIITDNNTEILVPISDFICDIVSSDPYSIECEKIVQKFLQS